MLVCKKHNRTEFDERLVNGICEFDNAKVLLAIQGYDPKKVFDSSGSTLLHLAAAFGNHDIVKYLIDLGMNVNVQDIYGITPLMLALERYHRLTIKTLLDANSDIFITDTYDQCALVAVLHQPVSWKILRMFFKKVRMHCNSVEEIISVLSKYNCPLYHAIHWKSVQVTRSRLEAGCPVNSCNLKDHTTALHVAVRLSDLANVKFLLMCGADVNAEDLHDRMPISYFNNGDDSERNLELLKLLIDSGASLYDSYSGGRMQMYALMRYGTRKVVNLILQHGVCLSEKDKNGYCAVHYLAENENEGVIEELRGRWFDAECVDEMRCTPLHLAASIGILKTVIFLLDNGADINQRNRNSMTPLFYAVTSSTSTVLEMQLREECIELLLKRGADAQFVGREDETVFDVILSFYNHILSKPILMHLAIQEALGASIKSIILKKINADAYFKKHFELYGRQLKMMKTARVYKSVTLFKLLTESDRKIELYARNQNLVKRLVCLDIKHFKNNHCIRSVRKRVRKAIQIAQSKRLAALAIDKIVKIGTGNFNVISDRIADYLSCEDVKNLLLV